MVDYYSADSHSKEFSEFLGSISDSMLEALPWRAVTRPDGTTLRQSCWFTGGSCKCNYKYSGTKWTPCPMPDWMDQLKLYLSMVVGIPPHELNASNGNLYEDGTQGLGPHSDNERLFYDKDTWDAKDATIVSISFGKSRVMDLFSNYDHNKKFHQLLKHGDVLVMRGSCQKHYQHLLPKDKTDGARFNFTFRTIRSHDPFCPDASAVDEDI